MSVAKSEGSPVNDTGSQQPLYKIEPGGMMGTAVNAETERDGGYRFIDTNCDKLPGLRCPIKAGLDELRNISNRLGEEESNDLPLKERLFTRGTIIDAFTGKDVSFQFPQPKIVQSGQDGLTVTTRTIRIICTLPRENVVQVLGTEDDGVFITEIRRGRLVLVSKDYE